MAAATASLTVGGIPLNPASNSIKSPPSALHVSRLLDRLEAQLEEEKSGNHDQWTRAGLAITLANATNQVDSLTRNQTRASSSYSSETDTSLLRSRLQRAVSQYNSLASLQPTVTKKNPAWSTSKIANPLQNTRQYLSQGLLEDSDSESDSEEEESPAQGLQASLLRGSNGQPNIGGIKVENEKQSSQEDEEDELASYETAARNKQRSEGSSGGKKAEVTKVESEAKPTALQSERSIQDSLSGELLRMAGILKTNSIAFADALERDRKILEEAGEKLQGNLTLMTRTRGKLGEYSRKARGMGWFTLGSVAVVCISWVFMFILIRLT